MAIAALWSQGRQEAASECFVPVEAEVLVSEVDVTSSTRKASDSSGTTTTLTYRPKITYRYSVGGKTYESERYAYVYTTNKEFAEREVAARPTGSTTIAYYDPNEPAESVIYRGGGAIGLLLVMAFLMFFAGIGLLVGPFIYRSRKAKIDSALAVARERRQHRWKTDD